MRHLDTPVEELMTPQPVALNSSDSIEDAIRLLERYPFRHLPVVRMNELVGMVSDRDLALVAGLGRGPRIHGRGPRRPACVEEISRRPVLTSSPSTPAQEAVGRLLENRIGALPVVSGKHLVGIVTETDFLRLFERCARWPAGQEPGDVAVDACMSSPVLTTAPPEDLLDAAESLLSSHVRHLPVVAEGELVGMLSDRDLRRGLARLMREDREVEERGSGRVPRMTVEEVMSRPCMTIKSGHSLRAAAHMLVECRIGALPVLRNGQMVGIVSQTDLLEHFRDRS